jgi:hypothetical protein
VDLTDGVHQVLERRVLQEIGHGTGFEALKCPRRLATSSGRSRAAGREPGSGESPPPRSSSASAGPSTSRQDQFVEPGHRLFSAGDGSNHGHIRLAADDEGDPSRTMRWSSTHITEYVRPAVARGPGRAAQVTLGDGSRGPVSLELDLRR